MSIYVNNTFRIKRSAEQQEKMQMLTSAKVFDDYRDILMISAIVGYNENKFVPIEKNASDGVLMQFFQEIDYDIMDLIAYCHEKEQSIIISDEKYRIFSSYANGGFPILLKKLGIENETSISTDEARKIQSKYYMLLLSNEFVPKPIDFDDDVLFI